MSALVAAGAAVWRRSPSSDVEIAVVHRPRYDDWSLPKGKAHSGELLPVTAVREVAEESGYTVTLGPRLGTTRYGVPEGEKAVHYWAAQPINGSFRPGEEVDELRWLPLAKASDHLSHQHDRTLLAGLDGATAITHAVLLVRHAKAGKSAHWQGDDDLRPLTTAGQQQAEVLRELLPLFGAQRIYSAPPLRCRQTVDGLAADLGVPIIDEPLLSDDGFLADPAAALGRLIEIAAGSGGTAVVCSQGEVIPDLVSTLAKHAQLQLLDVRSSKASYWGLFFSGGSFGPLILQAADYYDDAVG